MRCHRDYIGHIFYDSTTIDIIVDDLFSARRLYSGIQNKGEHKYFRQAVFFNKSSSLLSHSLYIYINVMCVYYVRMLL